MSPICGVYPSSQSHSCASPPFMGPPSPFPQLPAASLDNKILATLEQILEKLSEISLKLDNIP